MSFSVHKSGKLFFRYCKYKRVHVEKKNVCKLFYLNYLFYTTKLKVLNPVIIILIEKDQNKENLLFFLARKEKKALKWNQLYRINIENNNKQTKKWNKTRR